jgi:hypothetical protein
MNLPLRRILLRITALPVLLILAAVSLGILSRSAGGVVGLLFWRTMPFGQFNYVVAMIAAALFGLLFAYQFGLSKGEWRDVRRGTARAARDSGRAGWENLKARAVVRRRTDHKIRAAEREAVKPPPLDTEKRSFWAKIRSTDAGPAPEAPRQEPVIGSNRRMIEPGIVQPMGAPLSPGKRAESQRQTMLDFESTPSYELPPLQLLTEAPSERGRLGPSEESLQQNALLLLSVLEDFGVKG